MIRFGLKLVCYSFLFVLLLSLWGYYTATHPFKIYSSNTPADYHVKYRTLHLITKDKIDLHGWYIPAKKATDKAIILLHGYGADIGNILPGRIFLQPYYNLLFLDFRYFGKSGGTFSTAGLYEIEDLNAAVRYLKNRGIKKIGVWGLSMGGAVAIMAAEQNKDIDAIVAESPYASLSMMADQYYKLPGINIILGKVMRWWGQYFLGEDISQVVPYKAAENLELPFLLIHSKEDELIDFENARLIINSSQNNPHFQELILPDAYHGQIDRETQKAILNFFANNL